MEYNNDGNVVKMENKKIAIVLTTPYLYGDSRVLKVASSLSEDNEVTIFCLKSNVPRSDFLTENIKVVEFTYPDSIKQFFLRHSLFFYEYNFFIRIIESVGKYDIIYCNDLPSLNIGLHFKKKYGSKLIYDSHEIYLETINQFFLKSNNVLKNLIFGILKKIMKISGYFFEKRAVKNVDEFITVNETIAKYFKGKYKLKKLPSVLMNYPYLFDNSKADIVDYSGIFGWTKDDIILLYQGNLNQGRGLEIILKLVKSLPGKFKLVIIGEGILKKSLEQYVINEDLSSRVKFLGYIENRLLLNYTAGADIGFNLLEDLNKSKLWASPNKLFEYIQAEVPSVNTSTIENKKIVEKYNVGVLTENNIDSLKNAIYGLLSKKDFYKEKCRIAKKELCWEKQEILLKNINYE